MAESELLAALEARGTARGDSVALVVEPAIGVACAVDPTWSGFEGGDCFAIVRAIEAALRPRWVLWSNATASVLAAGGVRVATGWDIAAVARLISGGWRAEPDRVWAALNDLPLDALPVDAPPDLFSDLASAGAPDDPEKPVRADGYLRPDWVHGAWSATPARLVRWAELAARVAEQQRRTLEQSERSRVLSTARAESAAELLCAELERDGLPMDRAIAEALVADAVGPRPRSEADAARERERRDAEVLRHAPAGRDVDLRSPGQVKELLRGVGIDVPDTRAWRLEALRDSHPLVDALLAWRKGERVATTYGYAWLDANLHDDGRLRGVWSGSDGAAGRMTASAGLHNMPADMRSAVVAEPGHVFVRADLGQIEPRVLAAVSGDRALARASQADDMYAPVAAELGVDRATAKVAVLGAMYGQTTGHGARALQGLDAAYPVAMSYLLTADRAARNGHALLTYGGRLIPMGAPNAAGDPQDERARAGARGRYGRNAVVQGAAAELFKAWAVTVRARAAVLDARIVLCLHDELLVHAPAANADAVAGVVTEGLREAAHRWAPDDSVRFIADVTVIDRWSDAK